jgi:hypothetical protein
MNMNMEDKVVYLTMTYDILDGPLPTGWKEVKAVWFGKYWKEFYCSEKILMLF